MIECPAASPAARSRSGYGSMTFTTCGFGGFMLLYLFLPLASVSWLEGMLYTTCTCRIVGLYIHWCCVPCWFAIACGIVMIEFAAAVQNLC